MEKDGEITQRPILCTERPTLGFLFCEMRLINIYLEGLGRLQQGAGSNANSPASGFEAASHHGIPSPELSFLVCKMGPSTPTWQNPEKQTLRAPAKVGKQKPHGKLAARLTVILRNDSPLWAPL